MKLFKQDSIFLKGFFTCFLIFCFSLGYASDCDNISVTAPSNTGSIVVSGHKTWGPKAKILIMNSSWQVVENCDFSCADAADPKTFSNLTAGLYHVKVTLYTGSYGYKCEKIFDVTVTIVQSQCSNVYAYASGTSITMGGFDENSTDMILIEINLPPNYNTIQSCFDCPDPKTFTGLATNTTYEVKGRVWNQYYVEQCVKSISVTTGNTAKIQSNNPKSLLTEVKTLIPKSSSSIESMNLMPNPAIDQITIELESLIEEKQIFYVYNMQGKLLMEQETNLSKGNNQIQLDISNLPGGIYTVIPIGKKFPLNKGRFVKL